MCMGTAAYNEQLNINNHLKLHYGALIAALQTPSDLWCANAMLTPAVRQCDVNASRLPARLRQTIPCE